MVIWPNQMNAPASSLLVPIHLLHVNYERSPRGSSPSCRIRAGLSFDFDSRRSDDMPALLSLASISGGSALILNHFILPMTARILWLKAFDSNKTHKAHAQLELFVLAFIHGHGTKGDCGHKKQSLAKTVKVHPWDTLARKLFWKKMHQLVSIKRLWLSGLTAGVNIVSGYKVGIKVQLSPSTYTPLKK